MVKCIYEKYILKKDKKMAFIQSQNRCCRNCLCRCFCISKPCCRHDCCNRCHEHKNPCCDCRNCNHNHNCRRDDFGFDNRFGCTNNFPNNMHFGRENSNRGWNNSCCQNTCAKNDGFYQNYSGFEGNNFPNEFDGEMNW